jgi:hypothetical protein
VEVQGEREEGRRGKYRGKRGGGARVLEKGRCREGKIV